MNKTLHVISLITTILLTACQDTTSDKSAPVSLETNNIQKEASTFSKQQNDALKRYLPFDNKTDYDNAHKGFIATIDSGEIKDAKGNVVYSMKQYDFIKGDAPDTTNPSLWRQSEINSINGLFEVTKGVYQIRGFDLANMSLIMGEKGWIVVDPLLSPETARAGLDLANEKLGERPVTAVIITHSHIDHFGGIRGVVDEENVLAGKVPIYVPEGFFEHSISENVMGGNTMGRRASYMYGNLLAKDDKGTLGTGLGQTTSTGLAGILQGTDIINELNGEKRMIDGIEVDFIYTPESEAPAEMMFYFPKYKSFCQAEDLSHTLHNLYTLRGAQVRNGQKWSQYIDLAIQKWGDDVTSSFGSHHWPTWNNSDIKVYWESQRNLYRFIHDQTLRMANTGLTPREIAEELKLPESLDKNFANRGYYGSVSHDVRAQYQLYFGWFDGNPSNLHKLPPVEEGIKYVEFMGGADAVLSKAKASFDKGEYRWVATVLSNLVFSEPTNQNARNLLADTFEQLGYVSESGPWRNFYLTGAKELREGVKALPTPNTAGPDMIRGMSLDLFFNYMAMKFIGTDADAAAMDYRFNIDLPDIKGKVGLIVEDGTVTPRIDSQLKGDVTTTITINRADLDRVSLGEVKYKDLIDDGTIKFDGDKDAFNKFLSKIDNFKFWFNIVEP